MASTATAERPKPLLSAKARTRLLWIKVHRWLGLATLIVMLALGVTGSLLVWPDYFDSLVNPARHPASSTQAFALDDDFVARAQETLGPGDAISGIAIPEVLGAILVGGQVNGPPPLGLGPPSRTRVWLDPISRKHLDTAERAGGFIYALHATHGYLLLKWMGRELIALSGLLLLISSISGLYLLWPGRKRWKQMFQWQKSVGLWMNLHRQGGLWLAIVLIVEAITGSWIAAPKLFAALVEPGAITARAEAEGPPPSRSRASTKMGMSALQTTAGALLSSDAELDTVYFPTMTNPEWKVVFRTPEGAQSVKVNDDTGVAKLDIPPPPGRADKIEQVMIDLHFGHYGIVWQILVFLSGIALSLLSLTGIWLWYVGWKRRRKLTRKRQQA